MHALNQLLHCQPQCCRMQPESVAQFSLCSTANARAVHSFGQVGEQDGGGGGKVLVPDFSPHRAPCTMVMGVDQSMMKKCIYCIIIF